MEEVPSAPRREWSAGGLMLKATLAIAVSAGAAFWAFHDVDAGNMSAQLAKSSVSVMAIFVAAQLLGHLLRVVRWALLVRPLGPASNRAIFAAASVGFPASFFLPLRLGELVRPAMISRSGVSFAGAIGSVVVERVADGLVNVGCFFLFLRLLPADAAIPEEVQRLAALAFVLFGAALGGLVVAAFAKPTALKLLARLLAPVPVQLRTRIIQLLETFVDGLTALRTPSRILAFVTLTLAFWALMGLATWLLALSYVPGLPMLAGPFATNVVVFAIMVPAGPAFVGTLEAGLKLGLAPFAVDADTALAVAVISHALQLAFLALLAGIGLLLAERAQRRRA